MKDKYVRKEDILIGIALYLLSMGFGLIRTTFDDPYSDGGKAMGLVQGVTEVGGIGFVLGPIGGIVGGVIGGISSAVKEYGGPGPGMDGSVETGKFGDD